MAKIQKYGIKFPITIKGEDKSLLDVSYSLGGSVNSELMHVIFTPKGQRLRNPEFGTNLIQFIFNPNDSQTFDGVVSEVRDVIKKYIPNCKLNNINVYESEDGLGLYVQINYSVWENGTVLTYNTVTKL